MAGTTEHRQDGWQKRLIYLVDEELAKPFSWESANCGDLVGAAVMACHGPDHPVLENMQSGKSKEEVLAFLKEKGGLQAILAEYFEEVPKFFATDGDIGIWNREDGTVGCVILDGKAVGKLEGGGALRIPIAKMSTILRT